MLLKGGLNNMSVKLQIKSIYRDCSKTEKKIADYILQNPKEVSRMTISEIANELKFADSTVFQFTKKLGYKGFRDFRNDLLTEEFDTEISIHENIHAGDDPLTIAHKVFDSSIQSLKSTYKILSKKELEKAASIILNSGSTYLFGVGGSSVVCADAYHKFLRSPIKPIYNSEFHLQLMNASLMRSNDCAIIISHSGITKDTIQIAKLVKKRNAKIILITGYQLCELSNYSDAILSTIADETKYRSESLSSRIAQLAIIDSLYTIIMLNDEEKSKSSLHKIREAINETKE